MTYETVLEAQDFLMNALIGLGSARMLGHHKQKTYDLHLLHIMKQTYVACPVPVRLLARILRQDNMLHHNMYAFYGHIQASIARMVYFLMLAAMLMSMERC